MWPQGALGLFLVTLEAAQSPESLLLTRVSGEFVSAWRGWSNQSFHPKQNNSTALTPGHFLSDLKFLLNANSVGGLRGPGFRMQARPSTKKQWLTQQHKNRFQMGVFTGAASQDLQKLTGEPRAPPHLTRPLAGPSQSQQGAGDW
ncbi:hypothetical protein MDA_GLEAN10013439 [Myotis davidii]|uniref:Uncharacterized protein n=1 Tax=Myotis davidii TaxID=225400 RepID=L5LUZ3_MYODS|nr:hypothetical protein MDA_GLEAN10013439 [Myotis davidii]